MKVLVVLCHPRADSLTGKVAEAFSAGLKSAGHKLEFVDLYKENFNPVLEIKDEPSDGKISNYSVAVQREFNRLNTNDAVVMIIPLRLCAMPAIIKVKIHRVRYYVLK